MRLRLPRAVRLGALVALCAALAVPVAVAGSLSQVEPLTPAPSAETGQMTSETTDLWFVELAGRPASEGGNPAALRSEQQAFRNAAKSAGVDFAERFAFSMLWNGLSVQVDAPGLNKIAGIQGVKAVYPVATIPMPDPSEAPDLGTALAMTGADTAQSDLGYTGEGVKVAVMDTGIDYDHADLGGDGLQRSDSPAFPTSRVVAGWDFVGDVFNADPTSPGYNPVPTPDERPDDCNGHGTHVAGIVGADGDVTGVAPGVQFGAYRVFGCAGSTTADIMIAAMERALADGMDVLNMSIGSAFNTWPQYPTAAASDRLVDEGVSVVASIGNSGANGIYSASAPGVGTKVIGVASFDNSHINALTFNVNPSGQQVAYLPLATTPDPPTSGTSAEIVWVGRGCTTLGDTPANDPSGKVALVVRGDCTFQEKYQGAADAGAVGVVIYNNVTGLFAGGGVTSRGIFGVGISQADGQHIRSLLDGGQTVTLAWTDIRVNAPNPTGGLISSFSSYGLSAELDVKPDIGAPGGLIRSTYPLEEGGYATISGTSMAAPHVAGAVALLLQAEPDTATEEIRDVLQNSADPRPWWGNPGLGFLDNVHRQGAGMVDVDDAILATTTVTPGKLALGESQAGPQTRTLTVANDGSSAVTYDLSHAPALSTGPNTFTPGFFTGFASVAFSAPSLTVPAGGSATVDVTVTANAGLADRSLYGGYVVLTPQGGGQVYRVPYAGFKGDYQSIPILTSGGFGFPLLGRATSCIRIVDGACIGGSYTLTLPASFTMADVFNQPSVLVHLDHQARKLTIEVEDVGSGRNWQRGVFAEYLPRNSTSTSFFAFSFDGTTRAGNGRTFEVPDGTYRFKLTVQKALGGDADVETWTSPNFTIDRP